MAQKPSIVDAFDFSAAPKADGGTAPGIADAFDFSSPKPMYTPEMQATIANLDAENKKPLKAATPDNVLGSLLSDENSPTINHGIGILAGKEQPKGLLENVTVGAAENVIPSLQPEDYIKGPLHAVEHPIDSAQLMGDSIKEGIAEQLGRGVGPEAGKLIVDAATSDNPLDAAVKGGLGLFFAGKKVGSDFKADVANYPKTPAENFQRLKDSAPSALLGPLAFASKFVAPATTADAANTAIAPVPLVGNQVGSLAATVNDETLPREQRERARAGLMALGASAVVAPEAIDKFKAAGFQGEFGKTVATVQQRLEAQKITVPANLEAEVGKLFSSFGELNQADLKTWRKNVESGKFDEVLKEEFAPEVSAEPTQAQVAEIPKEGPTPVHAPEPIGIDAETGLPIYKRNAPEGAVETKSAEPALDAEMRGADPRLSLSVDATKEAAESGNPNYVARTTEGERIGDAKSDISAQTKQKVEFLEHLDPETRVGLAADSREIQDLLAQHFPEDVASKENAHAVAGKDGAANREVQDVHAPATGLGTESVQGTGSEGQVGPASEPSVRTSPEAPAVADEVGDRVRRGIDSLFNHAARNEAVRNTAARMVDEGTDPRPIMRQFWEQTFPRLSEKGRQMFVGQVESQFGMKPGDVMLVDRNGAKVTANDWRDVVDGGSLPESMADAEHPHQAVVALADILNERAAKAVKSEPELLLPDKVKPTLRDALKPEEPNDQGNLNAGIPLDPERFRKAIRSTEKAVEGNERGIAASAEAAAGASRTEKKTELPQGGSSHSGGMKFAGGPPNEPLPKYAGSINLERLKTGDDVKQVVLDTYNANKAKFDEARKPGTSFEQTKREAAELGWDVQKAVDSLKRGKIDAAHITAARQVTLAQNEAVRTAQKSYAANASTENFLKLQEELTKSATINQAMQGASAEAGRTLNAHKIFAEATKLAKTNQEKALANVQKLLGDKWRETADSVTEALARIPENDTAALNRFVRNYKEFTTADKVYAMWVANVLSGVGTNVKNAVGNLIMPPIETTVKVIKGVIDPNHTVKEATASVAGRVQGAQQGFTAAMDILRNGMTAEQAAKLEIPRHYEFTGWAKAWNVPGRLLSASDAFFKSTAISGELRAEATRIAFNEGAKGQVLDARVKQLLENPTEAMVNKAVEQSKFETFTTDPGKWTKGYMQWRNQVPPLQYLTPFVNVPINLLKRGIELTPGNFLKLGDPKVWRDGKASDAFARATIGTAIAIYAANKYASGELTGKAPADAGQRDAFLRTRQEYSVKVGNRWVKYTDFGPLAIPFLSAAAIGDATQTNKNFPAEQVATEAIGSLARGIYDQSFYKGLSDMMDTFGSGKGQFADAVGKQASGTVGGLVPFSGLLRSVKNTIDPKFRQPDNIYERIKSGLPIASASVPSRLNALGEEQNGSPLNGIFGFGLRDTKVPNLDIEKEIARLEITPKTPDKTLSIASRQFDLSRDQQRELTALLGDARKQVLRQLFSNQLDVTVGKGDTRASGTYGELDDEQKRAAINNVLGDAYDAARDEFVTRVNQRKESVKEKPKKAKLQFVGAE